MSDALAQAVAAEIRAESGRQRVSGRELARRIDEPVTTVSRWLRGDTPVGLDELDKIATALEVDVIDLIRAARLHVRKLPRQDSNLQPAGRKDVMVRGHFRYNERSDRHEVVASLASYRRDQPSCPIRTRTGVPPDASPQVKVA